MPESSVDNPPSHVVAVTGATGFVGRHLVHELVARGHQVRALSRDYGKGAAKLPTEFVSMIVGDVFDESAMNDLVEGADVVINLIGIRRELSRRTTFQKLHVDATQATLEAARRGGAAHFLQMSSLGARPEAASRYHQTKWEAEQLVRDSGLAWTIFRPSVILGPDGEFMQMARGWVRGESAPKYFIPYFSRPAPTVGQVAAETCDHSAALQPVCVRDVARAFERAIGNADARGEIVPLVGDAALSWPRLLTMIRDMTPGARKRIRPMGIPAQAASYGALAFEKIGLGTLLPFGPSEPIMAAEDNTGSAAKMSELFGIQPESIMLVMRWCTA